MLKRKCREELQVNGLLRGHKKLFERLKKALKSASSLLERRIVYRELSEEEIDSVFDEILPDLIESEIGFDAVERLKELVKRNLVGKNIKRFGKPKSLVLSALESAILEILGKEPPDLVKLVKEKCAPRKPYIIVFLGVNGVGKTTTIAKLAYLFKKEGMTPLLAAADTFRAGAQEQLSEHAEKLKVPIIRGSYGSDPASIAFEAVEHARAKNYCVVLIDTAGRMHSDYDLMGELKKIIRVVKPNLKVLVVDALTGNDAVLQAEEFDRNVGVDAVIITKTDSDVKGGVIVSVASAIRKPIVYLGTGQKYDDLVKFSPREFVKRILEV